MSDVTPDDIVSNFRDARRTYREAKAGGRFLQRSGRMAKDVTAVARGLEREKDRAGRPKMREWEKEWAKTAGLTAVAGLGIFGLRKAGVPLPFFPARGGRKAAKAAKAAKAGNAGNAPAKPLPKFSPEQKQKQLALENAYKKYVIPIDGKGASQEEFVRQRINKAKAIRASRAWGAATKPFAPTITSAPKKVQRAAQQLRDQVQPSSGRVSKEQRESQRLKRLKLEKLRYPGKFPSGRQYAGFESNDPTQVNLVAPDGHKVARAADVRGNSFRVYTARARTRQRRNKEPEERIEAERERHRRDKIKAGVLGAAGGLAVATGVGLLAHRLHMNRLALKQADEIAKATADANARASRAEGQMGGLIRAVKKSKDEALAREAAEKKPMKTGKPKAINVVNFPKSSKSKGKKRNVSQQPDGTFNMSARNNLTRFAETKNNIPPRVVIKERGRADAIRDAALVASGVGGVATTLALLKQNQQIVDAHEMKADKNRLYKGAKSWAAQKADEFANSAQQGKNKAMDKLRNGVRRSLRTLRALGIRFSTAPQARKTLTLFSLGGSIKNYKKAKKAVLKNKNRRMEPGTYVGDRTAFGPFRHEYVVTIPKSLKDLTPEARRAIRRVGPRGEKGVVTSGAPVYKGKTSTHGRGDLTGHVNYEKDVMASRRAKKLRRVGDDQADQAVKYATTFQPTKYPAPIPNGLGLGRNSNTFTRTYLRKSSMREPAHSWRRPGSKLEFAAKKDSPNDERKQAKGIGRAALTAGGLAVAGTGLALMPAALPMMRAAGRAKRYYRMRQQSEEIAKQANRAKAPSKRKKLQQKAARLRQDADKARGNPADFVADYTKSTARLGSTPVVGKLFRDKIIPKIAYGMQPSKDRVIAARKVLANKDRHSIKQVQEAEKIVEAPPPDFVAAHYRRFTGSQRGGMEHWGWERGLEMKNKIAKKEGIPANEVDPNKGGGRRMLQTHLRGEEKVMGRGGKLDQEMWKGKTTDEAIRSVGASADPDVKSYMKNLRDQNEGAAATKYGRFAYAAPAAAIGGTAIVAGANLPERIKKRRD